MKNKTVKFLLCLCVAFAVVFAFAPSAVKADTKDDYRRAQRELDRINKELRRLTNTTASKKKQKQNIEKQISLVKSQISILYDNIEATNNDLLAKQEELDNKKREIQKTDELFKERLKAMYMMRNSSTLSTILGANTVSELLTATDTLQRVSARDTDLLKLLDEERRQIETEEARLQRKIEELYAQQKQLEEKQNELAGYLKKADTELTDAQARQKAAEATQSEIYARYIAAKNAYEAELAESIKNGSGQEAIGGDFIWPVPTNGCISSGFGPRTLYGQYDYHTGIDIATGSGSYIYGKAIVASKTGTVIRADKRTTGYGYCVRIDHGGGYVTLYGHCSALYVGVGDIVVQGQTIARVGSTGNSTGPHLHFEIRVNGAQVDPLPYVTATRPSIR